MSNGLRAGAALATALAAVALTGGPAWAHGAEFDVVVEAVHRDGRPDHVAYAIVLTYADGDQVEGADVTVSASRDADTVSVGAVETTPGVYIADVELSRGDWRVELTIVTPEGEGSVEFTEPVGTVVLTTPVVRVDTAQPEGADPATPSPEIRRVEALVRQAGDPLRVEYGVLGAGGSTVTVTAVSADGEVVGPVTLTAGDGDRHIGEILFPTASVWTVTVAAGDGGESVEFGENLPWPHYTTEAGSPKVKVDASDPALEGTLIALAASPIFGAAEESPPPTSPGQRDDAPSDVVVALPSSASELARQTASRLVHVGALAVWFTGVGGLWMRRRPLWIVLAVAGMAAVIGTGVALALWGAPTPFPGILRWRELASRVHGPSYQAAFIVKMVVVALAVAGTALIVVRATKGRLVLVLVAFAAAIAAVTAMTQFHLLAHL